MRRGAILAAILALVGLDAARPALAQTTAEWTVMLYLDGDQGTAARDNQTISDFNELETVGSSRNLNLVVQWDRGTAQDDLDALYPTDTTQSWTATRRYLVIQDPNQTGTDADDLLNTDAGYRINSPLLLDLGELDMSSEDTLVDFCQWTFERFPAKRYMLVLSGDGTGWTPRSVKSSSRAMLSDIDPNNDLMSDSAQRSALTRIQGLLGANLPVLILDVGRQATIEMAYQDRDLVDYQLARWLQPEQDGYPYDVWMQRLSTALPTDNQTLETMLNNFASDYLGSYASGTNLLGGAQSTTVGVYRMSQLQTVVDNLDTLAAALLSDLPTFAPSLFRVLSKVQRGRSALYDANDIDLKHFCTLIAAEFQDTTVLTAASILSGSIDAMMVNASARNGVVVGGFNVGNFNGLAAYFPAAAANYDTGYASATDFVGSSQWDELVQGLLTLFSDQNGPQITIGSPLIGSTIIENPPTISATIVDLETGGRVNESSIVLTLDGQVVNAADYTYNADTGILNYPIPNALAVSSHTFSISASDLSGNDSSASGNFRIAVPSILAGVQTFSLPRLVTTAEVDPTLIFGRDNFSIVRWVPTLFGSTKYRSYPDSYASFLPPDAASTLVRPTVAKPPAGLGYWVRVVEARPLPSLPGTAVTDSEYVIQLYADPSGSAGWNMIADPFDVAAIGLASTSVRLDDGRRITFSQAINERLTPGVLFTYVPNSTNPNASGSYTFSDAGQGQLTRLQGHWLKVNQDLTLVISSGSRMTDRQAAAARARESVRLQPAGGWSLQLVAATETGQDTAEFGVSPVTRAAYDPRWDVAAPPSLPEAVTIRSLHSDWGVDSGRYVRDYRGPAAAEAWELEVAAPAGEVTVSWPSLRRVPGDVRLRLTDLETGQQQSLRTTAAYRFVSRGGTRALRLVAERRHGGMLQLSALTVTAGRGRGYGIGYVLSSAAEVQVTIRGLSGSVVRQLGAVAAGAGRGELYYDGRAADGSPLPNGIYQLEVTAQTADGELTRQLRTIRVVR